jgi:hypothetical protein
VLVAFQSLFLGLVHHECKPLEPWHPVIWNLIFAIGDAVSPGLQTFWKSGLVILIRSWWINHGPSLRSPQMV